MKETERQSPENEITAVWRVSHSQQMGEGSGKWRATVSEGRGIWGYAGVSEVRRL